MHKRLPEYFNNIYCVMYFFYDWAGRLTPYANDHAQPVRTWDKAKVMQAAASWQSAESRISAPASRRDTMSHGWVLINYFHGKSRQRIRPFGCLSTLSLCCTIRRIIFFSKISVIQEYNFHRKLNAKPCDQEQAIAISQVRCCHLLEWVRIGRSSLSLNGKSLDSPVSLERIFSMGRRHVSCCLLRFPSYQQGSV